MSMQTQENTAATPKIPIGVKLGYGIGTLGYAIPSQLLSGYFLFYCTELLGISGWIAGFIISISTIWDAITDPIMGYISDHTNNKIIFGRRLFYILIGSIGFAAVSFLLWRVDPQLRGGDIGSVKVIWVALLLILFKTFSTVYTTPYMALGAELSSDYNERTSVQSYRTAFFFLGFLFPSVIAMSTFFRPTELFGDGRLNPEAYATMGWVSSVIVLVCAAACLILTFKHRIIYSVPKAKSNPFKGMFKELIEALKLSDYRNISLALLFINMAMSIVIAVGMHVFTYTFGLKTGQIAMVFGALFATALLAQPAWIAIAKRLDKRRALIICLYINIAVSFIFLVYVFANEWVSAHFISILPAAVLMGFSMGGSISLPYSMISDTIDKDAYESGTRKEGMFYGCATFLYKLSQSAALFVIGALLDIIGFKSNSVQTPESILSYGTATAQPSHIYLKLGLILPIGFVVCFSLALFFARKYKLDRESVIRYQQEMDKRLK